GAAPEVPRRGGGDLRKRGGTGGAGAGAWGLVARFPGAGAGRAAPRDGLPAGSGALARSGDAPHRAAGAGGRCAALWRGLRCARGRAYGAQRQGPRAPDRGTWRTPPPAVGDCAAGVGGAVLRQSGNWRYYDGYGGRRRAWPVGAPQGRGAHTGAGRGELCGFRDAGGGDPVRCGGARRAAESNGGGDPEFAVKWFENTNRARTSRTRMVF